MSIPKEIYIIRHAQTDYNKLGIVQGSGVNSDINEEGKAQAQKFYEAYGSVPFEHVFISALKRTAQTVEGFTKKIPYSVHPELNEISWGKREGEKITTEEDTYYHSMLNSWAGGDYEKKIEGGESPADVVKRLSTFKKILEEKKADKVLVCTHGRTLRILLAHFLNYPLSCMDGFLHTNTGLYILHYNGMHYTVRKYNDTEHLK